MVGKCRIIKNDVFDIAKRIKEIDRGYFVVFDYKKRRFEVHNKAQGGRSFCLALPHKTLDARALDLIRLTRVERAKDLFEQMEKDNQKLQRDELRKAQKTAEFALEGEYGKA